MKPGDLVYLHPTVNPRGACLYFCDLETDRNVAAPKEHELALIIAVEVRDNCNPRITVLFSSGGILTTYQEYFERIAR